MKKATINAIQIWREKGTTKGMMKGFSMAQGQLTRTRASSDAPAPGMHYSQ
jgi:hypothetical protein